MAKKRVTIEIDEEDVREIMRRYSLQTKSDAVALAVRTLANQPMTRDEALAMEGAHAIGEIPSDRSPRFGR